MPFQTAYMNNKLFLILNSLVRALLVFTVFCFHVSFFIISFRELAKFFKNVGAYSHDLGYKKFIKKNDLGYKMIICLFCI